MFDINGGEFVVLAVVGLVVIGPERLPKYAADLGRMVREARSFARNAREQVKAEMGEDFDDVDWQQLDPRRYDPRRIVREALLDDDDEPRVSDRAPYVPEAMRPVDDDLAVPDGALPDGAASAGAGELDAADDEGHDRTRRPAYDADAT